MARLAAVEKGEYYPTPLNIVDTIASVLEVKRDGRGIIRIFDPCAGEGLALERLSGLLRLKAGRPVETWGVEISPDRAAQAAKRLDTVLEAPFEAARWSPSLIKSPVSMVFLNPPYDSNGNGGRLEQDFLVKTTEWLGKDTVLALLIPWKQLNWPVCQHLAANYSDVEVFRFPDAGGVDGFDAFGQIVVLARRDTGKAAVSYTYDEAQDLYNLVHPRSGHPIDAARALPDSPNGHRYTVQPVGVTPRLRRKGYTWEEIADAVQDSYGEIADTLLPDHTEMDAPLRELKVGHIAQVVAAGLAGTFSTGKKVFKGRAIKTQVVIPDPVDPTRETVKDVYETHIAYITRNGYTHLSQPGEVAEFLKEHADLFRQHVEAHFQPYGTDVQPWEWEALAQLSLDKQIPGRKERGLFEDQKRSAVALTRSVARYGVAHMIAEMGYGKTRTSLAAVELMHTRDASDGYPVLITCPPHLVDGWKKEAESAIPGLRAVIVETIGELDAAVAHYQPGDKLAVVVSHSRIKMGPGWEPAYDTKTIFARDRKGKMIAKRNVPVCPGCGKPLGVNPSALAKKPLTCQHTVPAWNDEEKVWEERPCATPLYQFAPTIARRWPLADYISHKLRGFFKVCLFDEVHKGKAKGTDIAWALQSLANAMPMITLTGTFFGGLSSSIMYLLHRTQRNVRDEFGFDDEKRWVERFGVLETTYKTEEVEYGAQSAKKRRRLSTKEQPGLSPEAIRFMLPTTVFARVNDLGLAMPLCNEEIVPIDLGFVDSHISEVSSWTWGQMLDNWPVWTSAWLQWNLARPNSAFRDEVIEAPDDVLECPAQVEGDELLPKEEWLVNLVKTELAQGRKVIVYLRQTGTRDIRARIQKVLHQNGVVDVAVLGSNVGTRKRSKWLAANARQVLITNPKLVETGMNLHEYGYATIVFFEIEYSLYTLWQAMSRVWRPGQTRKVKIFFAHYPGTLEEKALSRMGRKMMTGQLLYGEDVTSALVEDTGDASLTVELIRAIQAGEELIVGDNTQIFGTLGSEVVTESPMGSPTARSPKLTATEQWLRARGLTLADVKPARRSRRKKKVVPDSQMSFFDLAAAA